MQIDQINSPTVSAMPGPPVINYAPRSLKSHFSPAQRGSIAVLAIGVVLYSIACIPSYSRSFWPPIDRLWEATPWLWVFPIPMFTLVMPGGSFSRKLLVLYALLTSAIDAWTFPFANMNPHRAVDFRLWFEDLIPAVPVHLILAAVIALVCRMVFGLLRVSPPLGRAAQTRRNRRARVTLLLGIPVIAVLFPSGYRSVMLNRDTAAGAGLADADWANQKAKIVSNEVATYREAGGFGFSIFFDPDSGLPLKQSWMGRWEPGYNAEIRRLVKTRGIPPWSLKSRFVADADVVSMLTAADMKLITVYPFNISPDVVLFRGGGVTPWGNSIGSNSKYLDIESRNQANLPIGALGEEKDPAFVGQLPRYPGIYFIRCGNSVVVVTADGWVLQQVTDHR